MERIWLPKLWLMRLSEMGFKVTFTCKSDLQRTEKGLNYSFLPKVSVMLLLGLHARIIRNTLNKPSIAICIVWATYILGWTYNPLMFVCAHLADRAHVSTIIEVDNENSRRYAHARHILVGSKSEAQAILNEITNARKPLKMFKKWLETIQNAPVRRRKAT